MIRFLIEIFTLIYKPSNYTPNLWSKFLWRYYKKALLITEIINNITFIITKYMRTELLSPHTIVPQGVVGPMNCSTGLSFFIWISFTCSFHYKKVCTRLSSFIEIQKARTCLNYVCYPTSGSPFEIDGLGINRSKTGGGGL